MHVINIWRTIDLLLVNGKSSFIEPILVFIDCAVGIGHFDVELLVGRISMQSSLVDTDLFQVLIKTELDKVLVKILVVKNSVSYVFVIVKIFEILIDLKIIVVQNDLIMDLSIRERT